MAGRERIAAYKKRGGLDPEERRKQLAAQRREQRGNRRDLDFAERRGLEVEEPSVPAPNNRLQKLKEWKKNKNAKVGGNSVKPAFVVSKIKYDDTYLYKPPGSSTFRVPKGVVPVNPVMTQRVLRSQSKQVGASNVVKTALADFASAMRLANEKAPELPKKNDADDELNRTFDASNTSTFEHVSEIQYLNKICIPPIRQPENTSAVHSNDLSVDHESVQASTLCSTSSLEDASTKCKSTKRISSRNKHNCEENTATVSIDNSDPCLNRAQNGNFVVSEESTKCFWSLHKEAVDKLNCLCVEWESYKSEDMPETINDNVDVAIGYAKLLIAEKLQQFADLVREHENGTDATTLRVLSSDLDGFWGLVNNQVQDIYKKFQELSKLRENNWEYTTDNMLVPRKAKAVASKTNKAKGKTTSGLRSFLTNARKKVKSGNEENSNPMSILDHSGHISEAHNIIPMSPVVMKISLRAKQIGSPQITNPSQTPLRSPLRNANVTITAPKSAKTPRQKRLTDFTPGNTPLRRSTRLANLSED